MRKRATLLLITILAFQSILQAHANPTWNIQVVDPAGTGGSMVFDSHDNPHIIYYVDEFFNTNRTGWNYAFWTGTNWSTQNVHSGVGSYLRLDSKDKPHMLYSSAGLKYAVLSGTNWTIQTIDDSSERYYDSALGLDSNDNPHVVYSHFEYAHNYNVVNNTYTKDLRYAVWNGSNWAIQTIDTVHILFDMEPSIVLDSNNYPHIIYGEEVEFKLKIKYYPYVSTYSTFNIKYAMWTGSSWRIQTVASNASSAGTIGNIALDSKDRLHVSYFHEDFTRNSLNYAYWNGSTWIVQIVGSKLYGHEKPYLKLDSSDNPEIYFYKEAYTDNVTDSGLMCAKWTGSSWNIQTIGSSRYNDIALDSHGKLHITSSTALGTIRGAWRYGNLTYATLETTPCLTPTSLLITIIAVTAVVVVSAVLFLAYKNRRKGAKSSPRIMSPPQP